MGKKTIRNWVRSTCPRCKGEGRCIFNRYDDFGIVTESEIKICTDCRGSGKMNLTVEEVKNPKRKK